MKILCYLWDECFPIFFVATVGGSIELGAFDQIERSIRFQAQREFSIEFEDVARLIADNLVLLVNINTSYAQR